MLEGFEWETSRSLNPEVFSNGGSFELKGKEIQINLKKRMHLPTLMAALKVKFSPLTVT